MQNDNEKSKKLLLSLLISGVVGASALYYLQGTQNRKTPALKKIGKTISEVGHMLENYTGDRPTTMLETIEEKIPKGIDVFNNLTECVETGLSLWNKLKKG